MIRRLINYRLAIAIALVGLSLPACRIGGSGRPAGTPAGGPSRNEAAAVSAVVHDFFANAIGPGNWTRMAAESTGNIAVLAGWLERQGIAPTESSRGALAITGQKVLAVSGTHASVAFNATRTTEDYQIAYSGPVSVTKTAAGWKVADYKENGQSVAASIFPRVSGGTSKGGVGIKPLGVQLLSDQVNVWTQITNRTPDQLTWDQPIVVVDANNQQLGHGSLYVSSLDSTQGFVMTPQASAFGDFQVGNATLPLSTAAFTLVAGATPAGKGAPVQLQVPVRLG